MLGNCKISIISKVLFPYPVKTPQPWRQKLARMTLVLGWLVQNSKASLSCWLASVINVERYSCNLIAQLVWWLLMLLPKRATFFLVRVLHLDNEGVFFFPLKNYTFTNSRSWKIIWTAWRMCWANKNKAFPRYDYTWINPAWSLPLQPLVLTYAA